MVIIEEIRRMMRRMKALEEQMAVYSAYHQNARNKATHFIGVPIIVLSLFIPLAWLRADIGGVAVSAGMLLGAIVLAYYLALDLVLGAAMVVVFALLLWIGEHIAALGAVPGWTWFAVLFVGGWILQLVGHVYEGRRPALTDNLFQIFIAPIFLCAEVFFALGYRPQLRSAVEMRARRLRGEA